MRLTGPKQRIQQIAAVVTLIAAVRRARDNHQHKQVVVETIIDPRKQGMEERLELYKASLRKQGLEFEVEEGEDRTKIIVEYRKGETITLGHEQIPKAECEIELGKNCDAITVSLKIEDDKPANRRTILIGLIEKERSQLDHLGTFYADADSYDERIIDISLFVQRVGDVKRVIELLDRMEHQMEEREAKN